MNIKKTRHKTWAVSLENHTPVFQLSWAMPGHEGHQEYGLCPFLFQPGGDRMGQETDTGEKKLVSDNTERKTSGHMELVGRCWCERRGPQLGGSHRPAKGQGTVQTAGSLRSTAQPTATALSAGGAGSKGKPEGSTGRTMMVS